MSDHKFFNCSEQHEHDFVVRQYALKDRGQVRDHLKEWCKDGTINYSTHEQIYSLIKSKLGIDKM